MMNSQRPAGFSSTPVPEAKIQDCAKYPQCTAIPVDVSLVFAYHFHGETSPLCKTEILKGFLHRNGQSLR